MKRLVCIISLVASATAVAQTPRQWTAADAHEWYIRQPWILGANYIQSNTVNQIEMWQQESFDPARIDMELGWAENVGINTLRIFLHELLWDRDSGGLTRRMNKLLTLADKHKMRVIFVLFDSEGDPYPEYGHQRLAKPGVRNSLGVQSPGAKGLSDPKAVQLALAYAENVVATFNVDRRILAWDVWNEPDNTNVGRYSTSEPANKLDLVRNLLPQAFQYVRAGIPTQPVTSGLWQGDWSSKATLSPIQKIQVELSDFVSFQNYYGPEDFEKRVQWLQAFGRPVVCTGFLARGQGSTIGAILPIAVKYDVGAIISDLVQGKTQKWLPWDSWLNPYVGDRQPKVWEEDLFRSTGPLYQPEDAEAMRKAVADAPKPLTTKPPKKTAK